MRRKRTVAPAVPLDDVRRRFERWRRLPKADRRIPKALWRAAVEAAGEHGVSRTARALRLNTTSLKHRLQTTVPPGACGGGPSGTPFVELLSPPLVGATECVVELEDSHGARMRIELKGADAPDLATLARVFWGNGR